jgi:predicted RNase H-like HicB family nuclease
MKLALRHDYKMIVYWSNEDNIWIGQCPELFGGGVHADDPYTTARLLISAVEDVLHDYKQTGADLPKPKSIGATLLGSVTSARKKRSSAENGKRGGRPRKHAVNA